ncbi:hypothetical protein [Flammeovirga sp. SubArs3]|uniref:hypothetical protein n=1 Tax=Flammeovirga sp. SubArs3 TaxID=2995316 RepID=UPI00248BBF25|nr:hypothetical protein [Flammeovirga sp. SubArs3]
MIKYYLPLFFVLLVFGCTPSSGVYESQVTPTTTYQIGYGLGEYNVTNNLSSLEIEEDIVSVLTVSHFSEHYAYGERKVLILRTNTRGRVVWSKLLSVASKGGLTAYKLLSSSDGSFIVLGSTNDGAVVIKLSTEGQVISTRQFERDGNDWYSFYDIQDLNDEFILIGSYGFHYNRQPFIASLDAELIPVSLGKLGTSYTHIATQSNSIFLTKIQNNNEIHLIKVNDQQEPIWKKGFEFNRAMDGLRKVVVTDNYIYIVGYGNHLNATYLFVLDHTGKVLNGLGLEHPYGDLIADQNSDNVLLLIGGKNGGSKLFKVSPDLQFIDEKYIARLTGKHGDGITGKLNFGAKTLNYQTDRTNQDPLFGNRGFHIARIIKGDWYSNCEIYQNDGDITRYELDVKSSDLELNHSFEIVEESSQSILIQEDSLDINLHTICD